MEAIGNANHQLNHMRQYVDLNKRHTMINWLSHHNFADTHRTIFSKHKATTCRWLLESQELQTWRDGTEQLLWCPGIPGAGKTVASAVVIDYLQRTFGHDPAVGIAFVYCQFDDKSMKNTVDIVASLLQQVVQGQKTLSNEVEALCTKYSITETRPEINEILPVLRSEVQRYSNVYIIIDALDEYPEHARINLLEALGSLSAKANVLITSRPLDNIARQLRRAAQLEIQAHADDVEMYIKERISESALLQRALSKDLSLEDSIIDQVTQNAGKMFAFSSELF